MIAEEKGFMRNFHRKDRKRYSTLANQAQLRRRTQQFRADYHYTDIVDDPNEDSKPIIRHKTYPANSSTKKNDKVLYEVDSIQEETHRSFTKEELEDSDSEILDLSRGILRRGLKHEKLNRDQKKSKNDETRTTDSSNEDDEDEEDEEIIFDRPRFYVKYFPHNNIDNVIEELNEINRQRRLALEHKKYMAQKPLRQPPRLFVPEVRKPVSRRRSLLRSLSHFPTFYKKKRDDDLKSSENVNQ